MKDGPLGFKIVPHKDRAFYCHLEVGPLPSNFIFPSVPGPFLRDDEEFGRPREVVEHFKNDIIDFTCVIFQIQGGGLYKLGLDDPPNTVDFCITPPI